MNAFRSGLIDTANQILINIFCHKRNHRCCTLCNRNKGRIERHVSIDLILLHALCPETFTASSDIPVTHVIHKALESSCCFRNLIMIEIIIHLDDHGVQLAEQPFIHDRKLIIIQGILRCIKVINICIEDEECISIPQGSHEFTLSFHNSLAVETVRQPWCGVNIEVPADRICTIGFKCIERIYGISFTLAHLLSVLILNVA